MNYAHLVGELYWDFDTGADGGGSSGAGNVGHSSWVEIDSGLATRARAIEVKNTSGSLVEVSVGKPPGTEARAFLISPNDDRVKPFLLTEGQHISIRAAEVGVTIASGELIMNFYY